MNGIFSCAGKQLKITDMAVKDVIKLLLSNSRSIIPHTKFHTSSFQAHRSFLLNKEPHSPLWMTTLPKKCIMDEFVASEENKRNKGNNKNKSRRTSKKAKAKEEDSEETDKNSTKPLLITCKNKEFNFRAGMHYKKFSVIPLASKGWHHRKSVGDYFSILPIRSVLLNAKQKAS